MTNKRWRKKIAILLAGCILLMHSPTVVIAQEDTQIETASPDHEEEKEKKQEKEESFDAGTVQSATHQPEPQQISTPASDPAPASATVSTSEMIADTLPVTVDTDGQPSDTITSPVSEMEDLPQTATDNVDISSDDGAENAVEDTSSENDVSQDGTDIVSDIGEERPEDITEAEAVDSDKEDMDNSSADDIQQEDVENVDQDTDDTSPVLDVEQDNVVEGQNEDKEDSDSKKKDKKTTQIATVLLARDAESDQALTNSAHAEVTWITTRNNEEIDDKNDINDIRPGYMKVTLQKSTDGWKTYEIVEGYFEYKLNEDNGWKVEVVDLPKEEDGKEIQYRWIWDIDHTDEDTYDPEYDTNDYNVVGYIRTQNDVYDDGMYSKRTYVHELQTTKYTISINWDDCGDETAKVPDELEITLPDGSTAVLKKSEGWKLTVDLPIMHRDLDWTLSAVDGWVSGGSSTDYNDDATEITFNRRWATEEVQTAAGTSTLKVQYWIGSNEAAPMFVGVYENGQTYNVSVPRITGYRAQVSRVRGTINGNTIINVRYVPNTYTVTVYYRYLNGQTAAPTAYRSVKTGTGYTIGSPAIRGYVANVASISGTVTGRDLTYVVYYTGTGAGGSENVEVVNLNEIDDYKTPLGLGEVGINAGECFE